MARNLREVFEFFAHGTGEDYAPEVALLAFGAFAAELYEWSDHEQRRRGGPPTTEDVEAWIMQIPDARLRRIREETQEAFGLAARAARTRISKSPCRNGERARRFAGTTVYKRVARVRSERHRGGGSRLRVRLTCPGLLLHCANGSIAYLASTGTPRKEKRITEHEVRQQLPGIRESRQRSSGLPLSQAAPRA
jgi:hypothetical protein